MHKYNKATTKYKDIPNGDDIFKPIDKLYDSTNDGETIRDCEHLNMWLANLSMPSMCCGWVSEEHFNNLLEKYKIDVTPYVKDDERITTSIKGEIQSELFNLIEKDKYKKRNLIKALRNKFPEVNSGVICRLIKKLLSFRILEIDKTFKTKPFIIKGKYYIK